MEYFQYKFITKIQTEACQRPFFYLVKGLFYNKKTEYENNKKRAKPGREFFVVKGYATFYFFSSDYYCFDDGLFLFVGQFSFASRRSGSPTIQAGHHLYNRGIEGKKMR